MKVLVRLLIDKHDRVDDQFRVSVIEATIYPLGVRRDSSKTRTRNAAGRGAGGEGLIRMIK